MIQVPLVVCGPISDDPLMRYHFGNNRYLLTEKKMVNGFALYIVIRYDVRAFVVFQSKLVNIHGMRESM